MGIIIPPIISKNKLVIALATLTIIFIALLVAFFSNKSYQMSPKKTDVSASPSLTPLPTPLPWYKTIEHTELDAMRSFRYSNVNGIDICGYTEADLKQITNVSEFEKPINNAVVKWDWGVWSPKCTKLVFTIESVSMKGNQFSPLAGVWTYEVTSKKRYMLPKSTTFKSFINDDLILINGFQIYDFRSSRIVTDITPSNIRFRNPNFPWSFLYGIDWEYLPKETVLNGSKIDKAVFRVHDNLKVELYRNIPDFDKSHYKVQQIEIQKFGQFSEDKLVAYTLNQYYDFSENDSGQNVIKCEQWFTNSSSKLSPAAIHFMNTDTVRNCQYEITTEISNNWLTGNGFQFQHEFTEDPQTLSPTPSPATSSCPRVQPSEEKELLNKVSQINQYIQANDLASILDLSGPTDTIDCTHYYDYNFDPDVCKNAETNKSVKAYVIGYRQSEGYTTTKAKVTEQLKMYGEKYGPFSFVSSKVEDNCTYLYTYKNPKNNYILDISVSAGSFRIVPIIQWVNEIQNAN
jgi:hypothetical protein